MIKEKELTGHLEEVILILEEEVTAGNLTTRQYYDYVRMIRHAANRVFAKHRNLWREVDNMTKPMLRLPSMELKEKEEEIAKQKAEIADRETKLANKDAEIAEQAAEIQRLKNIIKELSPEDSAS